MNTGRVAQKRSIPGYQPVKSFGLDIASLRGYVGSGF